MRVDGEPLILAEGLRRAFGSTVAVQDLNLRVDAGQAYGLVGPDGAGKSTTMRLLCGAIRCDAGRVVLGGIDLERDLSGARAQIGYLPQRFSLYGELTVEENLRFFAEVRGLPSEEWEPRSREILEFVGLTEFVDRRAEALSGGMRQKLGLAAALVHRPRILLLDEPTTGVDPVTRQGFWQLIIRLLEEGVAVLVSTPYMDEASRCHRLGFMSRGRILVEGSPAEVARRLEGRILEVVGAPLRELAGLARSDAGVETAQLFGDRLHLQVAPEAAEAVMRRLPEAARAADLQVDSIRLVPSQLEDVFIHLLESEEAG
ncbi:MAG: ABC transporter ATP-binding protein [Chloroflexi bacterium]|nr:ABC transporter ATP-binding protein [Chloroflexota bacterium]